MANCVQPIDFDGTISGICSSLVGTIAIAAGVDIDDIYPMNNTLSHFQIIWRAKIVS